MKETMKGKIKRFTTLAVLSFFIALLTAGDVFSQKDFSVGGFIDEDGDGFNDLLPDSDGDGVPDGLDPDSGLNRSDSSYMHRYMHEYMEQHQMMWENMEGGMMEGHMEQHGEPGMFGPGDSTMHGGQMGGGHHGGGGMGGGMDPGGGMGGGMDDPGGGGMGGGMGPDSKREAVPETEKETAIPQKEASNPGANN